MRLRSSLPSLHLGMAAASVGTLGLSGTYLYLMAAEGRASVFLCLFLTPFFLVGAGLGYFGLRGLFRLARYGRWELEVPGSGGVLGRPLPVTLHPGRAVAAAADLQCRLRCVRLVFGRQGVRSSQTVLWQSAWTVPATTLLPQGGLPLTLPLPEDGPVSQRSPQQGTATVWQLNVVVESSGMTEEPVFDIPVSHG